MLAYSLKKRKHHEFALPCPWPRPGNSNPCASISVGIKHIEIAIFIAKKGLFVEVKMMYQSVLLDEH
jgi:hypothetical protein